MLNDYDHFFLVLFDLSSNIRPKIESYSLHMFTFVVFLLRFFAYIYIFHFFLLMKLLKNSVLFFCAFDEIIYSWVVAFFCVDYCDFNESFYFPSVNVSNYNYVLCF